MIVDFFNSNIQIVCIAVGLFTMTWNDTDISDVLTFIYHDELTDKPGFSGPGTLLCISRQIREVFWSYPDGSRVMLSNTSQNFLHLQLGHQLDAPIRARLSRNPDNPITTPRTDELANGLWQCHERKGPTYHVGIYARVPGEL